MTLLFVGGVMTLAWVATLAAIVLIEKLVPLGGRGAAVLGVAGIVAGVLMAIHG